MKQLDTARITRVLSLVAASVAVTFGQAQSYTIPVVVHVLWDNSIFANISDAQVMSGIDDLNTGFNSLSFEPTLQPPYDVLAADMEVEFCLATTAPDGSPTTGILRYQTPLAQQGGTPESYMDQWPPERYLNIWVIQNFTGGGHHFTYSPAQAAVDPGEDGIMIRHNVFGSIGTSSYSYAPTIIYNAGRYLDLKLLWEEPIEGTLCGDDGVEDTPPSREITDCIYSGPDGCAGTMPVMLENYMTYSFCNKMFTQGQKLRVHAALNSPVAHRNNLWSAENLGMTGCGPVAMAEQHPAEMLSVMAQGDHQWLVHGPSSGAWSLSLYTTTGLLVGSWHSAQGPVSVDLSGHARGLYVLQAASAGAYRGHAKVVVE
ncbi:MAG TPA: M43 family zinc metalloprotease [Flavobacteriales bacterium]|nr:M43 family zinc metalloprotease [Flavobacteriales bacterium]HRP81312.1 M43 family zinc metalloprotease [Flavobacteriales bacterium]